MDHLLDLKSIGLNRIELASIPAQPHNPGFVGYRVGDSESVLRGCIGGVLHFFRPCSVCVSCAATDERLGGDHQTADSAS